MSEPAFDIGGFAFFLGEFGEDTAREAVAIFIATTHRTLEQLVAAAAVLDLRAVAIDVHAVKSAAATFGFARLATLAGELERDIAMLPEDALPGCILSLRDAFAAGCAAFRRNGKALPADAH